MDWVEKHCERLRTKLQASIDRANLDGGLRSHRSSKKTVIKIPWSWVCRATIETVKRYPSGLTEAIVLAELELRWRRDVRGTFVPGKLQGFLDAQYAPLSEVVQAGIVCYSDQLVTLAEDHAGSASYVAPPATVDMYLHQNFKSCRRYMEQAGHDLLASGRKLRLTGLRMLTGAFARPGGNGCVRQTSGISGSTLLLTEYLAFLLDHRKPEDLRLALEVFGRTRVRDTLHEAANEDPYVVVCKVVEVRRPRQSHDRASGSGRGKRLVVQTVVLRCVTRSSGEGDRSSRGSESSRGNRVDPAERTGEGGGKASDRGDRDHTVLLRLWDEQMCLSELFRKGDALALYWPWVVCGNEHESSGGGAGLSQQAEAMSSKGLQTNAAMVPTPHTSTWYYEYGSATTIFVLPRDSREQLLAAVNGKSDTATAVAPGGAEMEALGSDGLGGFRDPANDATFSEPRAKDVPPDENGVRDLLQFPSRVMVADIGPNMVNLSLYGEVVRVAARETSLPAVLPSRLQLASQSQQQASLSGSYPQPVVILASSKSSGVDEALVLEVAIRDASGQATIFCSGQEVVRDALRCRPGQFVLACGIRTFELAAPTWTSGRRDGVALFCGETEVLQGGAGGVETEGIDARGVGGSEVEGASRILHSSCLEGLLQCPFLSRHRLLHTEDRVSKHQGTFTCKAAVTWARWEFAGDGLWAVHRRCQSRLPCSYRDLDTSASSPRLTGRKRWRDIHQPGEARTPSAREVRVKCPLCKCAVNVACVDEAELAYGSLLIVLDDGSRCILAECLGEVVAAAFGGVNAHAFLDMDRAERDLTLSALIGREIRCVVSAKIGAGCSREQIANLDVPEGEADDRVEHGEFNSGARYRVERIAPANPAADLAQILSKDLGKSSVHFVE